MSKKLKMAIVGHRGGYIGEVELVIEKSDEHGAELCIAFPREKLMFSRADAFEIAAFIISEYGAIPQ
ncbi:MAG: hypothetical protein WDN46_22975 [Methylocella sp.]